MKVVVSVPGKIHLMGEHAVVYGKPALLAAINRRMVVTVEWSERTKEKQTSQEPLEIISSESDVYVKHIIAVVAKTFDSVSMPPLKIMISSTITPGYHLGSSAATAVGVSAALIYVLKKLWNPTKINEVAYEAEKKQHGTPSGGDNTAVCFGGLLWYRKELEFLKSMWQLPLRIDKSLQNFFLLDTGRPVESTGEMIALVRDHVQMNSRRMYAAFADNEIQTKRLAQALKQVNEKELMASLSDGQKTLETMGVVSSWAKKIIGSIKTYGGAAKILGGGGKQKEVGYLLCYHPNPQGFVAWAKEKKYTVEHIQLGEEGICLEQKE